MKNTFTSIILLAVSTLSTFCTKEPALVEEINNKEKGYGWKQEKCWLLETTDGKKTETLLTEGWWYADMFVESENILFFYQRMRNIGTKYYFDLPYSVDDKGLQCTFVLNDGGEQPFFTDAKIEFCDDSTLVITNHSFMLRSDDILRLEFRRMSPEELIRYKEEYKTPGFGRFYDCDEL